MNVKPPCSITHEGGHLGLRYVLRHPLIVVSIVFKGLELELDSRKQ